jgi:hypothetical protein
MTRRYTKLKEQSHAHAFALGCASLSLFYPTAPYPTITGSNDVCPALARLKVVELADGICDGGPAGHTTQAGLNIGIARSRIHALAGARYG